MKIPEPKNQQRPPIDSPQPTSQVAKVDQSSASGLERSPVAVSAAQESREPVSGSDVVDISGIQHLEVYANLVVQAPVSATSVEEIAATIRDGTHEVDLDVLADRLLADAEFVNVLAQ